MEDAITWLQRATNAGGKLALVKLTQLCIDREKLLSNKESLLEWFCDLTSRQGPGTDIFISMLLSSEEELFDTSPADKFQIHEVAVKNGWHHLAYELANMYESGTGTSVNKNKAYQSYELAARYTNDRRAMFKVGEMLYVGDGVEQNNKSAIPWFEKAARKGCKDSLDRIITPILSGDVDNECMTKESVFGGAGLPLKEVDAMCCIYLRACMTRV